MPNLKIYLFLTFSVYSILSISQNALSSWTEYSAKNLSIEQKPAHFFNESTTFNNHTYPDNKEQLLDQLDWINKSIKSITFINSNETIFGSGRYRAIYNLWDIYLDYYSVDTYDYMDLDVLRAYSVYQ